MKYDERACKFNIRIPGVAELTLRWEKNFDDFAPRSRIFECDYGTADRNWTTSSTARLGYADLILNGDQEE